MKTELIDFVYYLSSSFVHIYLLLWSVVKRAPHPGTKAIHAIPYSSHHTLDHFFVVDVHGKNEAWTFTSLGRKDILI